MPSDEGVLTLEDEVDRSSGTRSNSPTDRKPVNGASGVGARGERPDRGELPIELWPIASVSSIGMLRGLIGILVALGLILLVVGVVALVALGHSSTEHARLLDGAVSGGRRGG
ncbi:MAG: hypothetical protein ACRDYB_00820 [Acidimicrobiales bacterium]